MRRPRRARLVELLIYAALLAAAALVLRQALDNLADRGVASGFGFLGNRAGFDVGFKLIAFDADDSYGRAFLVGLLNTLLVALVALVLATLLGLAVAVARLSRSPALAGLARGYVEIVRNCPLLLQILAWYFLALAPLPPARQSLALGAGALLNNRGLYLPAPRFDRLAATLGCLALLLLLVLLGRLWQRRRRGALPPRRPLTGRLVFAAFLAALAALAWRLGWELPALQGFNVQGGLVLVPEFIALALALAIYGSAFIAEIFRASILAVGEGQGEAARALGCSRWQALRLVILPLALRSSLPPLTNQYVNIVKYSSLAAAIGYPDLMQIFAKTTLNQTGQAVEVILMTMAVYLAISLAMAALMRWYEGRVALVSR